MNQPKKFYRELDAVLAKIGKDASGENFLVSILNELEQTFGDDLQLSDGSIYEQRDKDFILIYSSQKYHWIQKVNIDSAVVRLVTEHGSFIYDHKDIGSQFGVDAVTPAAIYINTPERQWLIVFALKDGWTREEVILFLNAVRTALNYRLFSEMVTDDLQQAVRIQKGLLPKSALKVEGFQIAGRSIPAELVGGDFYEYFVYDDNNFGVSIGDASGHGLPAALLVRDVIIGLRMGLASEYKLVHTVRKLNSVIQRSTYASSFVSLFIGEFEKNGHLFYVNAGHPAPFIINGDEIIDLGPTGIVLGYLTEIDLHRSYTKLEPGSALVMYTDGIFERRASEEEEYGLDHLKDLVRKNRDKQAREIVDLIFEDVYKFGNYKNWEDDATVVVIKRE